MADIRILMQSQEEEPEESMETNESPEETPHEEDDKQEEEEEEDNSSDAGPQIVKSPGLSRGPMIFGEPVMPSPLDVTTPEELLTPLARLRSSAISENIFNRRMVAHDAFNILQAVQNDENDFSAAVQCYLKLSEDLEPSVRVELMEQLPEITEHFHTVILDSAIIPILLRYLTDVNNQVRKTCHAVLVDVTKRGYLKVDQFESEIMPLLRDLTSRQQAPDEYRTEAVGLVCQICDAFGPQFAKEHFLPIFLDSCHDETMFHVRKVCAGSFSVFCDIFENDLVSEDLLPQFVNLCTDNVWGVRKACAENFPDFAKHVSEDIRINTLSPLYSALLSDQSRWVRVSAFESLGPFISTFADSTKASDRLNKGVVESADSQEKDVADEEIAKDFDSFMYWRDPLPPVTFEDEGEPVSIEEARDPFEEDIEEIQSQVYVNSGSVTIQDENRRVIVVPTGCDDENEPQEGADESDSTLPSYEESVNRTEVAEEQDSEYSPTKDGSSIQTVEFSAEQDGSPMFLPSEQDGAQEQVEVYDNMETVPSTHAALTETRDTVDDYMRCTADICGLVIDEDPEVEDEAENAETKADIEPLGGAGDQELTTKIEKRPDTEERDSGSSDEDDFDDEAKNWQTPNVEEYGDLYDCDYGDGSDIHYRMFGTDSLSYSRREWVRGEHHAAQCSTLSFEMPPSSHAVSKLASQQDVIPQQLLDNFLSMTDPSRKQTVDTEIAKHCAFSLPGVAYTLGRNNWHCLKDVYHKLATDVQWKVRRTIASSIHELAKILGEELTATELVPVFNGFLKDLDDVRIGVLQHLADFLQLLNPEVRGIYLYQLTDFLTIDNSRNWRFRYELARQLCSLIDLYNADDTWKYICPISVKLATDKVVAVQEEAAKLVATILAKLQTSDAENNENGLQYFPLFTEKIIAFLVKSQRWKERTVFCKMCKIMLTEVMLPFDTFLEAFCPSLIELAKDRIVNVRICAAKVLSYVAVTFCDEGEGEDIFVTLKELQQDKDRDVRYFSAI